MYCFIGYHGYHTSMTTVAVFLFNSHNCCSICYKALNDHRAIYGPNGIYGYGHNSCNSQFGTMVWLNFYVAMAKHSQMSLITVLSLITLKAVIAAMALVTKMAVMAAMTIIDLIP